MENSDVARKLDELALLLAAQGANRFRVRAYERAADTIRHLERPVSELVADGGADGLERLRGIGPTLARAVCMIVETGRLPMLDRIREESDPALLLSSVPGVGRVTARRLVEDLGIRTLEELETAAHDSRLENVLGLPAKTVRGIADSLAQRLSRVRHAEDDPALPDPPVDELLEVDRDYRENARAGTLRTIAPRRFNPTRLAWLPIMHARRGARAYTALFSNTARAHQLERTGDWVIVYWTPGRQATVVTETQGELAGKRVVRGREEECGRYHAEAKQDEERIGKQSQYR